MINETKSRLERARYQYENLLLHSGNALLLSTTPPRSTSRSPPLSKVLYSKGKSPLEDFTRNINQTSKNTSPYLLSRLTSSLLHEQPEIDPPNVSNQEKDEIIISLQEENERLREKLQLAIESAEQVINDAQLTNDELVNNYEHRIKQLEELNHSLLQENQQLKVSLELAQAEKDVERDSLTKSLRIIDKFKRRSKEYLEIQKKTHQILSQPDGFHFTIYSTNPNNSTASLHNQPKSKHDNANISDNPIKE